MSSGMILFLPWFEAGAQFSVPSVFVLVPMIDSATMPSHGASR